MKSDSMFIRFRCFMAACLLVMAGGAGSALAQTASVLAPGDVVKISVYGNPDLTTIVRVSDTGMITFPLIGEVNVGGASTFDAEQTIADRLDSGGFVKNAAVSVFVQERSATLLNSVTLLGQVKVPGKYSLEQQSVEGVDTLIGLLAKAGGTTATAADHLFLIRQEGGASQKQRIDLVDLVRNANMAANVALANGDVVLVPDMDVFYIYGEVQKPGRYRLERDMTVMQAIAVASGMTPRGSEKGIVVNRQDGGASQSVKSELTDHVKPNDVVFVKTVIF